LTYSDDDEEVNDAEDSSNQNVHDDWENLDEKEYDVNQVLIAKPKIKKTHLSHLKIVQNQEKTLFTSTPSHDKVVTKTATITRDQNEFNKILIDNAETSHEKKDEVLNSGAGSIGGGIGGRVDLIDSLKKDQKFNENTNFKQEFITTEEATDLFEKMLNLMSSLIWDGISGSSEEAWKVEYFRFLSYFTLNDLKNY
jgi:hypothetical protein